MQKEDLAFNKLTSNRDAQLCENSTVGIKFLMQKEDFNVAIEIVEESLCSVLKI